MAVRFHGAREDEQQIRVRDVPDAGEGLDAAVHPRRGDRHIVVRGQVLPVAFSEAFDGYSSEPKIMWMRSGARACAGTLSSSTIPTIAMPKIRTASRAIMAWSPRNRWGPNSPTEGVAEPNR